MRLPSKKKNNIRGDGAACGVALLTIAGLVVKLVGLFYKIPITNLLGNEGMGYFGGAYTVYLFFYSIAAAGIPTALSIIVSRTRAVGDRRFDAMCDRVATALFGGVGLLLSAILFFACAPLSNAIGNPSAKYALAAIAPSIFFTCLCGVLRGWFQGRQTMLPTALSQITEALVKLLIGVFLANYAIKKGYSAEMTAAYAILGITIGSACSMVLLLFMKFRFCRRKRSPLDLFRKSDGSLAIPRPSAIAREIVRVALPVTMSSAVVSLSGILDLATVMHRLRSIGYSAEVANAVYGNYSALAVTLVNMPLVLIAPISTGLVPYVSEAAELRDNGRVISTVESALTVTSMIAMPASLGLLTMSRPILTMLFEDGAARSAAPLLSLLAPSLVFIALANVSGSLLQALGGVSIPLFSMTLGSAAKLIVSYVAIGKFGISGTPIGTFVCYLLITAINFAFLAVKIGRLPPFLGIFVKPLTGAVVSALSAAVTYKLACRFVGGTLCVLISIVTAVAVYLAACVLSGSIDELTTRTLPMRKRIAK